MLKILEINFYFFVLMAEWGRRIYCIWVGNTAVGADHIMLVPAGKV